MSQEDEDDGLFDENDDDSDDEEVSAPVSKKSKSSKKRKAGGSSGTEKKKAKPNLGSMIDDAAEESGDEGDGDDEDDDDDDDNNNEYVKDGFVVDEVEEEKVVKKKRTGDLEDSDDDDDDDDEDDDDGRGRRKKAKKFRKVRELDRLDEDDLDLVREARGETEQEREERLRREAARRKKVVAQNQEDLRNRLFYDSGEDDAPQSTKTSKQQRVERYDEDGMDDFIDDDIGDQGAILASELTNYQDGGTGTGVSEAQLDEAAAIFGSDYLDYMQQDESPDAEDEEDLFGNKKFKEQGVGVDLGLDSDEDDMSEDDDDDDDDLFGEDSEDGVTAYQKAEALKLKREKRELARKERRQKKLKAKSDKRKAQLRKAFEPVQLIENFCTDRDDEIRQKDCPERFFDWSTPFHGVAEGEITPEEEEEALWIMNRIPEIRSEYTAPTDNLEEMESQEKAVTQSIAYALRMLHEEKLEPAFIKRYRKDVVTSEAVRASLYAVMDEDAEWETMANAKLKVDSVLENIAHEMHGIEAAGAELESVQKLQEDLKAAEEGLQETANQEEQIKTQIDELGDVDDKDEDDEDELFGDDDDDGEKGAKKAKKEGLENHLATIQALLQVKSEKVVELTSQLQLAEARSSGSSNDREPAIRAAKKICRDNLWNQEDLVEYLAGLTDVRHILDVNVYLKLIKEGNDAIRKKDMPSVNSENDKKSDERKRSRRFDRDFYRTCVAEGHRDICYRFLLPPNRVGIKLEDFATENKFDYAKTMPGEDADAPDPQKWDAPTIPAQSSAEFASDLVGSGELVLLSSTGGMDPDDAEASDPLRGCRYVAAMELAHEPRIRRHMRNIYRRLAVLTTRPTKKGMEVIDAFHDYFGLHLIKSKPIKEHFPMDEKESADRRHGLSVEESNLLDAEMKKRERDSCLQYLNILKAEKTGHVSVHIHLPINELYDDWYAQNDVFESRDKQDVKVLLDELKKVYLPMGGDTEEWNEERNKVLKQTLMTFLLPQFEAEARRELREAAVKVGVIAAGESLQEMAMVGPYRPHALLHTQNRFLHPTGDLPIVGVCVSTDSREGTYLAGVTESGELQDHLAIPGGARVDSDKYREKVISFLMQTRPAAVLIGTSGGFDSRMLSRKMNDIVQVALQRWESRGIQGEDEDDDEFEARQEAFRQMIPRSYLGDDEDDDQLKWTCNVDLMDDSVSQLFGRSVRGKKEFPDQATNLKIATSIARYAKDPLAELTYAWSVASDTGNFGAELLYINIHPMQQLLPSFLLLRQYERALCEVLSSVGVDVNSACKYDHLHGLLSFVPGLGPRKAANLKQNVAQLGGAVGTRRSLLEKRLMGPVVYNNAVAFLRIQEVDQLMDQLLHPLDDTRLHPDVYQKNNWAAKIATDALERAEGDARNKEKAGIKALRDVIDNSAQEVERLFLLTKEEWEATYGPTFVVAEWDPTCLPPDVWRDKVEELDLETFAQMIESNGLGRWHSHLQMIKWEFRLPFADPRKPMDSLNADTDKLFKLITGETDQSLRPGKEVTGKVIRNGEFGSRVKLEGDIPAFIPLRNLSDEHVETAEDIVTVGTVVTAVITEVKKDHMCVDMSLKMEDFRKQPTSWDRPATLPAIDHYFDIAASKNIEEKKAKEREARLEAMRLTTSSTRIGEDGEQKRMGRVTRRACAHPAFRNSRNEGVNKELEEGGEAMVGEALIRPSSKSADSLAIHWVVKEGSIKVIEVTEDDKDTDASIGNILKIKDEVYGSIDELLGRYIAPMNDYVEELTNHRKFVDMLEDDLDEKLRKEKTKNPKGVFYNLCWMEMHAGYASLRFIMSSTPRHHPVGISPSGFVWGSKTYSSLDMLLNDFKKNPRGNSVAKRPAASNRPQPPPQNPSDTSAPRPSRWGNRPPAPPAPPAGWGQQAPAPTQGNGGWGGAAAAAASTGGWNQPPPPGMPPPPSGYGRPAPPARPPPPTFGRPPPPGPPPQYQQNSQYQYQQPPAPPGYPPRA